MAGGRKGKKRVGTAARHRSGRFQPRRPETPNTSHEDYRAPSISKSDATPPSSPIALRGDTLRMLDELVLGLKNDSDILESAYAKTVRYRHSTLRHYKNGTGLVYGEIREFLIDDIIDRAQIASTDLFVDLGSGYGNVVVSVALKTGCEAKGIELRKDLCDIAKDFVEEVKKQAEDALFPCDRCTILNGDFIESTDIDDWIKRANVIFVNGVKFEPETNLQLAKKLFKMKDGARLVFLHDWIEILSRDDQFDHQEIGYGDTSVSWTGTDGRYYIATALHGRKATTDPPRYLRARSKTI